MNEFNSQLLSDDINKQREQKRAERHTRHEKRKIDRRQELADISAEIDEENKKRLSETSEARTKLKTEEHEERKKTKLEEREVRRQKKADRHEARTQRKLEKQITVDLANSVLTPSIA